MGSGVAGLVAALVAALEGARPLVVERAATIGGTGARSSGTLWIPDNHHLRAAGIRGDRERARTYLLALGGDRVDVALLDAFLDGGPAMLLDLERRAGIVFRPYPQAADYRQDVPGAASGFRALEPPVFDGRRLGRDFARIEPPIPELALLGGRLMVTRAEAARLARIDRSPADLAFALGLFARYLRDRLAGWPRGTRLVLGNALVARLLYELLRRGGEVWTGVRARRLLLADGRVVGLEAEGPEGVLTLKARHGVVLAGGGFPAGPAWRARWLPEPVPEHTPAAPGADGSTLELALEAGAALAPPPPDRALWFPSSLVPRRDGTTGVYPHIVLDRAKPGLVAVDATGRRFVDEAVSYHEFVRAMYRRHREVPCFPAWLVCDSRFLRRYGLGAVRPRDPLPGRWVRRGYLVTAPTIPGLARAIGVDPAGLAETVERVNRFAASGVDEDFGKGSDPYDRSNGDPEHRPNPCLGPLRDPPFFAVAVWPTPLATSLGLAVDARARVLDARGRPIPGLWACGNDMRHPFGGEYPGPGAQLGPASTFARIAARDALGLADGDGSSTASRHGEERPA